MPIGDRTVNTPSAAWQEMEPDRQMVRDLLSGTRAMRNAGTAYLPMTLRETTAAYNIRLNGTYLFPGLRHTIETFVGRVLGQPIDISGVAPQLRPYMEDIDRETNNLTVFARQVFFHSIAYGVSYILVDADELPAAASLADMTASGARPYFVHVDPQRLIGWRQASDGSVQRIRIRETIFSPQEEWDDDSRVEQVRVIEPERYSLFRRSESATTEQWVAVQSGDAPDIVSVVPLYTGRTGFFTARSPVLDIAWLNLCHWQSYSDQRHIEHIIRVPILHGAGVRQEDVGGILEIGSDRMVLTGPDARLSYIEHSGEAANVGRKDIDDLEKKISELGAMILNRPPVMETATKTAIDSAESGASLASMVQSLQDSLNIAIWYMARMLGLSDGGQCVITADIPKATEAAENVGDGGSVSDDLAA